MTQYQKYLFDDFVIGQERGPLDESDVDNVEHNDETSEELVSVETTDMQDGVDVDAATEELDDQYLQESVDAEPTYSQEELDETVKKAKEEAWLKGKEAALEDEVHRQNELLEEIKNQLSLIFAGLNEHVLGMEEDGLRFFATCLHKVLPTIDSASALPEIKNFLQENFANLRNNKSLAFYFAPDMAKTAAPLIEKIAEQNDFEGKISIHKDEDMGLSDCRIEWKDGYVERDVNKLLEKIDELLANNK